MDKLQEKRSIPYMLKMLLTSDIYLTDQFLKTVEKILVFKQLKVHYKLLEVSCHGLLWFPGWLTLIWLLNSKDLYQMQINFLIGLILDIILVALLKATVRRRRPAKNDDPTAVGPDKFSFPSGHASRALFIAYFFIYIWPVHFIFILPLLSWVISVCISRVLMRRHYLLDVFVGAILGIAESCFIGMIYLENETCTNIISWLTDEKLDGGEYHV